MLNRIWIDGPLVSSYQIDAVIVGQCVEQTGNSRTSRSWANFDLSQLNREQTGPRLIQAGYRSVEDARTAMELYWAEREP